MDTDSVVGDTLNLHIGTSLIVMHVCRTALADAKWPHDTQIRYGNWYPSCNSRVLVCGHLYLGAFNTETFWIRGVLTWGHFGLTAF